MPLADTATPEDIETALRRLYKQRERAKAAYYANHDARKAAQLARYHDPAHHEEYKRRNREAMRVRNAAKKAEKEAAPADGPDPFRV